MSARWGEADSKRKVLGRPLLTRGGHRRVMQKGQDQLDQSHLRDIDIHENRDERRAFNHVKDRLAVGNKKSVSPGPGQ